MKSICCLTLCAVVLGATPAIAGTVSGTYTDVAYGTTTDLTATGNFDWVKFGLAPGGIGYTTERKSGVTPIISDTLAPLGTVPVGQTVLLAEFSSQNVQDFEWDDGTNIVNGMDDTVVTETISPGQFDYPLGLGAEMTALGAAGTRALNVYVQGFNADTLITASMSGGGSDSVVVSPKATNPPADPSNHYSTGVYSILYSGAGETLTVSVVTVAPKQPGSVGFPNAGFYAAALIGPAITGDISMDGEVDIGDFTLWADAFGDTGDGLLEDISGDGQVDIGDFTLWADNFGMTAGAAGLPGAAGSAVPEPSSIALLGIGMIAFAAYGWRRRKVSSQYQ